jgi:transcription elongation factor GreA
MKIGLISIASPLARALIGRLEGDLVSMMAPGGERNYEIIRVEYL